VNCAVGINHIGLAGRVIVQKEYCMPARNPAMSTNPSWRMTPFEVAFSAFALNVMTPVNAPNSVSLLALNVVCARVQNE
jgi:hypothetical protein